MLPKDCPINKPKKKRSRKKDLEGPVVKDCLNFLVDHPRVIYVERRNTGAVQFQDGGFIRFGSKGAADIWCLVRVKTHGQECVSGRDLDGTPMCHPKNWDTQYPGCDGCIQLIHVEIECKRADGKGRQSEAQKKFQKFCDDWNIPYILTTSASYLAEQISAIVLDK
ncbi:hypothetical protein KAR91_54205 [Candidatus Pacearchaeota archaeon]|nr:hypothetical protein [Candidatus Pacearchaeota archaeon]